jgi:hypothetical protein
MGLLAAFLKSEDRESEPAKVAKAANPTTGLATLAALAATEIKSPSGTLAALATLAATDSEIQKPERPASLPAPEPATRPPVAEPEPPETAVARRLDEMAAENDRRRDWWRASPYEPDGSLVIRSALTGEEITIHLPKGTRH